MIILSILVHKDIPCWCLVVLQLSPSELLPYLYIGDEVHSRDHALLSRLHITAVLNVSASMPQLPVSDLVYKLIPVHDTSSENISAWFNEALQFIGGCVYVTVIT